MGDNVQSSEYYDFSIYISYDDNWPMVSIGIW